MRVLVTGGTGYLGRAVVASLQRRGHEVRLLARGEAEAPPGVSIVRGDVTDPAAVARALSGADAVLHLAACVSRVPPTPDAHERVNVDATRRVLEDAAGRGIRAVYTSSFLALGPTAPRAVADESGPFVPPPEPETPYACSKRRALAVARGIAASGADLVTVVPGMVYGPGPAREANYVGTLLARLLARRLPILPAGGRTRVTWAWREDVAEGHAAALARGARGETYILGGEVASLADVMGRAARLARVPAPSLSVPLPVLAAVGSAVEAGARLAGRAPALTRAEVAAYGADWAYASTRAERELGYAITPLAAGLAVTLRALGADVSGVRDD